MEYKFTDIEKNCKDFWKKENIYKVDIDTTKPKFYVLDMFPYPSGAGLHVGHPLGYVASDIYARYKRLKGFNVLHPMGYDAFGLPAEQYAIETGTHPAITTDTAIKRYREQMDKIGFSFDWSREVKTCDPNYYKWTQWIFLKLFNSWYNREKNKAEPIETLISGFETYGCTTGWKQFDPQLHPEFSAEDWKSFSKKQQERILQFYRLAYRSYTEVNWCEALGCVLANDEVKDGKSERGGYPVTRKRMRQWSLRITEYADRLLDGLNTIDWSESLKDQQRNWIGRSEGALLQFHVPGAEFLLEVFTTRIDTLFGATFLVVAPEHEYMQQLITDEQRPAMEEYLAYVGSRSDIERQQEKAVTGCFTGSYAEHPFTGIKIPIWTAEYVLAGYGTGAIMAVPADDERDRKFAEKFGLTVIEIIDKTMYEGATIEDKLGKMINSDFLNGMEVKDAIEEMIKRVEEMNIGKRQVNYKLRDASYSRQRYWGEPFPIKYEVQGDTDSPFVIEDDQDEADIPVGLDESQLPVELPQVESYKPSGDGRSPLATNADWVAKNLETDTMPGYAGSSWYYFRYMDPQNNTAFAGKEAVDYWQNVDVYFGGSEHAVGHLLYSRFWHKVLFDLGYAPTEEPFKKLVNQGMIQGVSSVVYRVNGTKIFLSKGIIDKVLNSTIYNISEVVDQVNLQLGYQAFDGQGNTTVAAAKVPMEEAAAAGMTLLNHTIKNISALNIDISFVSNDELDINEFRRWRNDYADAELVLDNGKYICGSAVEKMSKSKYNVVNPDDVIAQYGADCFRMFEMFLGPIEQSKPWDDKGISGVSNFLKRFWRLFYDDKGWRVTEEAATPAELKVLHKTLKKIGEDIEKLNLNTSVSAFMIATNELTALKTNKRAVLEPLLIALAPFAPFATEWLWGENGFKNQGSIHQTAFPQFDEKYLTESEFDYPVSINGKVRAQVKLSLDMDAQEVEKHILGLEQVTRWTNSATPKKFVFVKGRIINVVV
ncbi:MAG TPA: class I tRNA ligase family protein [Chitinophagales bacterium]|nr:class I tRNA ligase family protein [Chitinophagales bacterium]